MADSSQISSSPLESGYDRVSGLGVQELHPAKRSALVKAAKELLGEHSLAPEFFENPTRSFVLFALANRALLKRDLEGESEFLRHATYLLTDGRLTPPMEIPDRFKVGQKPVQERMRVFDAFTSHELTARLQAHIEEQDLLAETHARLGLSKTEMGNPFDVVALDVSANSKRSESLKRLELFKQAMGWENERFPSAWIEKRDGKSLLVLTRDFAEDLFSNISWRRDQSVGYLTHEYVHAQGDDALGRLGSMVEERKADLLSGDKHGYNDVKQFFVYLRAITGYDIRQDIRRHPRESFPVYANMARHIGLDPTLQVAYSFPRTVLKYPNESMESISGHLGSRDGVLNRLMDRETVSGRGAAMNSRLQKRLEFLTSIFGGPDAVRTDIHNNLRGVYGLPSVAERLEHLIPASTPARAAHMGSHPAISPRTLGK